MNLKSSIITLDVIKAIDLLRINLIDLNKQLTFVKTSLSEVMTVDPLRRYKSYANFGSRVIINDARN